MPKHILISADGGLGDHATAEPAIRYLIEHFYRDADVHIAAHWPRMYEHLGVPVHQHNTFDSNGYQTIWTMFNHDAPLWRAVCFLACHMVDFHSMLMMQRMLPGDDRTIRLKVKDEDRRIVETLLGSAHAKKIIAVHAGKSWGSKTFPLPWWQEVVDRLAAENFTVCLFGKSASPVAGDKTGIVPVVCPKNGIDLRDKLELGPLFALLEMSPLLLTNDSSPVQLAGAFDNWIIMPATIKHPDLVFPYRNGSTRYKTKSLHKRLLADEIFNTHDLTGVQVDFEVPNWSDYLPTPEELVQEIARI